MKTSLIALSFLFLSSVSMAQSAFIEMKRVKSEDPSQQGVHLFKNVPGQPKFNLLGFEDHGHLIPDHFRYATPKEAQRLTDKITIRIFDSERARKSLCFVASEAESDIAYFLGVSQAAAKSISSKCQGYSINEYDRALFKIMKMRILGAAPIQQTKKYAYFYAIGSNPMIEGFTARDGMTLIMLNEKEVSEGRLIRVIAHEIAMSFDRLGRLSPEFSTEKWDDGINAVFGSGRRFESIFEDVKDSVMLRCALGDPAIRYGAATERAFRFEDQVIEDLKSDFGAESTPLALKDSCERIIGKRAVQISPLVQALMSEIESSLYRDQCGGFELLKDAKRVETLVGRIKLVAATDLRMKKDGKAVNLCSIFLNPQVGPREPETMRHGGPRPRGSGW